MAGDRILTVKLAGDAKGAVKAIGQTESAGAVLGKKMLKIGAMLGGLNLAKNIAGGILTIGKAYDGTMNNLQAVSGANEKMMKRVGDRAKELGSDLTLPATSASEAAASMLELFKGGLKLQQSMKAAKGTIQLAAAAQIDGARAAEIQANALSQFSLKGKDATLVADTLANVSDAATGGIEDVAQALSYVGPVAAAVGMNIGQTSTAIGLLAKNAIIGSKGGTALRGILVSLKPTSEKAATALDILGIRAFDQQGNFVGLAKVTEDLAKAKKRLTKEEFIGAAAAAFGREPLAAINALAKEGAGGWNDMAAAVGREGTAAKVAAAKNKGLGGAVDKLQSQLEDTALAIYDRVEPALTSFVESGAKAVSGFNDALAGGFDLSALNDLDGKALGKKISDALSAALDSLGSVAKDLSAKIGKMFGKVDWVGLGIELGKAAIPMLAGLALGILNFDLGALLSGLGAHWQELLLGILTIVFAPAKWIAKLAGMLRKIPFVGKMLAWLVEGISGVGKKVLGFVGDLFKGIWSGFKSQMGWMGPSLISRFVKMIKGIGPKIAGAGRDLVTHIGVLALEMAERFGKWLASHGPRQAAQALGKLKDKIFGFFGAAGDWLKKHGGKIISGLSSGVKERFGLVTDGIRILKDKVLNFFAAANEWLYNAGMDVIRGLVNGIKNMAGAAVDAAKNVVGGAIDGAKSLLGIKSPSRVFMKIGRFTGQGFVKGLAGTSDHVKKRMDKLMSLAKDSGDKGMQRIIARTDGNLKRLARTYDRGLERLKRAQDRARNIRETMVSYSADLRSAIVDSGAVTGTEVQSFAGIINSLNKVQTASRAFFSMMRQLKAKGLNKTALSQLFAAGPIEGLQAARSILQAGQAGVAQVNNLQASIAKTARATGQFAARSMYQDGLNAANGFARGLERGTNRIERQMRLMGRRMVRAIRKELRIHSPSRVFATIGGFVGDGFNDGVEKRFGDVGHVLSKFTKDMSHAASSAGAQGAKMGAGSNLRAGQRPVGSPYAGGFLRGSNGSAPVVVYVTVQGNVTTEHALAKNIAPVIREEFIKVGKRNGGRIFG